MRLKKYDRDAPHSYVFGVFPALELLRHQPSQVIEVLLHSKGERNEGVTALRSACAASNIPVEINDKLIERIAPRENTFAIGVFRKYSPSLNAQANHVVLVNPGDMGNLGTILRTMLGFGFRDLALIRPAVDIFDPRVVRASMGALFQANFAYYDSFDDYRAAFGTHRLYPFMTDGELPLRSAHFEPPFTLIFGSESAGLSDDYRVLGTTVTIPHTESIDSLNLSVAIGIALYEAGNDHFRTR